MNGNAYEFQSVENFHDKYTRWNSSSNSNSNLIQTFSSCIMEFYNEQCSFGIVLMSKKNLQDANQQNWSHMHWTCMRINTQCNRWFRTYLLKPTNYGKSFRFDLNFKRKSNNFNWNWNESRASGCVYGGIFLCFFIYLAKYGKHVEFFGMLWTYTEWFLVKQIRWSLSWAHHKHSNEPLAGAIDLNSVFTLN